MAEMIDLIDTKEQVESYISEHFDRLFVNSDIHYPESPNSKLYFQIKYGETVILEMSFWLNDQCRCEAVDLDEALLIFEDEISIKSEVKPSQLMCEKVKLFNDYIQKKNHSLLT